MTHPFGDLGVPIIEALGAPLVITRSRPAPGQYITGQWVSLFPSTLTIDAVVQPLKPKEIELVPENERTSEGIAIFTVDELQTSDVEGKYQADEVTWKGRRYKVVLVEDWTEQAGYARAFAMRLGP